MQISFVRTVRDTVSGDMWTAILAVMAGAVVVGGCATPKTAGRPVADVEALRGEVQALREEVAAATLAQDQARATDRAQAQAEIEGLQARARDAEASARKASAEAAQLRARVDEFDGQRRQGEQVSTPPPAPVVGQATAVAATPERPAPEAPDQVYAAALAMLRSGEHGQAILEFLAFIDRYPTHSLVPNARYWIGEAYYAQRDYRQALTEFQRLADQSAPGPKSPDALLKVGLCFERLSDPRRAQLAWQRVVREYPNSEAATRARSLLGGQGMSAR
jgi:tol-pal system protein YbgF